MAGCGWGWGGAGFEGLAGPIFELLELELLDELLELDLPELLLELLELLEPLDLLKTGGWDAPLSMLFEILSSSSSSLLLELSSISSASPTGLSAKRSAKRSSDRRRRCMGRVAGGSASAGEDGAWDVSPLK